MKDIQGKLISENPITEEDIQCVFLGRQSELAGPGLCPQRKRVVEFYKSLKTQVKMKRLALKVNSTHIAQDKLSSRKKGKAKAALSGDFDPLGF